MLKNLYVLIIIIIPIVQIMMCKTISSPLITKDQEKNDVMLNAAGKRAPLLKSGNASNKGRRNYEQTDPRYFDSVVEAATHSTTKRTSVFITTAKMNDNKADKSYEEIKTLLAKVLEQIDQIEKKRDDSDNTNSLLKGSNGRTTESEAGVIPGLKKKKKENESSNRLKWGHWTDWSSCSVSCGKGRQIRWRHCVDNCDEAETEMEEKTCQLPACGPGKLFGVIKL